MLHQNEKKAMTAAGVCSREGLSRRRVLSLRFSLPQCLWIHLLLALCAGFAAPASAQSAQGGNIIYFIEVTVEPAESGTVERDITVWLQSVLENNLQTCTTRTTPTTSTSTFFTSTFTSTTMSTTSELNITSDTTSASTTANASTTVSASTTANASTTVSASTTANASTTVSASTTTSASTTANASTTAGASTTATASTTSTASTTVSASTTATASTTSTASTTVSASTTATASTTASTSATNAVTTTMSTSASTATTTITTSAPAITTTTVASTTKSTPASTATSAAVSTSTSVVSTSASTLASRATSAITTSAPVSTTSSIVSTSTRTPASTAASTATTILTTPKAPPTVSVTVKSTDVFTPTSVSTLDPGKNKPTNRPNENSDKERKVREASVITKGLFQFAEVDCGNKTFFTTTTCFVTLTLEESVEPCCLLRTLCSASEASTNFTMSWKCAGRAGLLPNTSDVCSDPPENTCVYTGQTSAKCDAYEIQSAENKCNCSAYCNNTDAYYVFNVTAENPSITESTILSLLSSVTDPAACPLCSEIASIYKSTSISCKSPAPCTVLLHFAQEVSICDLSELVTTLLGQKDITMSGLLRRAAICGKTDAGQLLQSYKEVEVNIKPDKFCGAVEESELDSCRPEETLIVILNELCDLAQADALLALTKDASKLNSSQINQIVTMLENLLSGPNVSLALGNTSVEIVSNLQNATLEAVDESKNRIMGIVDTVGQKLVLRNDTESLLSEAVALTVQKANGTNFEETYFSISDPNNVQVESRATRPVTKDSSVPQGSIRLPQTLTENLPAEEQEMVSRVQFNFYQKSTLFQDKALGERILNSGIIGARVSNVTISGLQHDIIINLRNTQPVPENYTALCVFWDFTYNDGSGGWNSKGCSVRNTTDSETICSCNHLTSFGILLNPNREPNISRLQATILTFITYIGCGISAIFLAVTLLTYLAFGKLRKDIPSKILIQLCLSLLLLNLVFLVDAWLALYPDAVGLCISTAWFLHYFLLVAFTWMGLEGVHMYIALVKVFNSYISRYMVKFSLAGWGIPMIVVIIVIAIDKDNYGLVSYGKFPDGSQDEFCWIKNDVAFYVAVVAYYCLIFLFNIIMFVVVLVQLCRIKRQNPQNVQHRNTLQDIRSVLGITILLGLTWGFAFFAWGELNLPFMYLFAIFNSLQGFFIFVFHCAVKENVRRQWRTYLCCGRMRLAENSEWSRTATQKTGKKSSTTKITPLHSSKSNNSSSSSSYLVSDSSDPMNGYGGPLSDHIITADEDPRMDVIFNELNSQYRRL